MFRPTLAFLLRVARASLTEGSAASLALLKPKAAVMSACFNPIALRAGIRCRLWGLPCLSTARTAWSLRIGYATLVVNPQNPKMVVRFPSLDVLNQKPRAILIAQLFEQFMNFALD